MSRLIIENSTSSGTMAIAAGESVLWEAAYSKSGELAVAMQRGIAEAGWPEEIIVGIGPGSYTGLRVASATAIGLSLALGCPTFGCPSVLGYDEESYRVIGDARRGSIFLATIDQCELVKEPELLALDQFHLMMMELGDRPLFAVGPIPGCGELPVTVPSARYLAARRSSYRGSIEPLYLKEPHTTGQFMVPGS
jgi:tRNA A37 threonylcarbamoyladenosine modification protein TsaB